jgi:hypothetical protein
MCAGARPVLREKHGASLLHDKISGGALINSYRPEEAARSQRALLIECCVVSLFFFMMFAFLRDSVTGLALRLSPATV